MYLPKVGDHVKATRKTKSSTMFNWVLGPVVEAGADSCRIMTNIGKGPEIEGDFILPYEEFEFRFIYRNDGKQRKDFEV